MVPHRKLHSLADLSVIELWLSLEFRVEIVVDLFRLSNDLPPVILVLLDEADWIALTEIIHVFKLLALNLTSQATSGSFNHFLNVFQLN